MKLYQEDLTQEQFNVMLARIDAEKVATGISDITVNKAVKAGKITKAQLKEIAEYKMPDLNANDVEAAMRIIEGTARNMGITVED